jgi:glycosyltransferase involved in cell wall biosynthesis
MQINAISVVIVSFNEEKNIGRCIDSVRWVADEIIVVDSYSTDSTVAIAKHKGAIVKQEQFTGYIQQKNKALQLASNNYILNLDADEALSIELADAILEAKRHSNFKAFTMNRCSCFCGQFIRRGLWYPDRKLRLFDRRVARWGGMNPHDKIELLLNTPVKHLEGEILHYAFDTVAEYLERNETISAIAAQSLFTSGKKVSWSKIILSPFWAFINGYFLRMGFLDGYHGLLIAVHTARQSYLKYLKLQQLQRQESTAKNNHIIIQQPAKAAL